MTEEEIFERLPEVIKGDRRCAITKSAWIDGWFVPWSPRNENQNAEGPWEHWVALAHAIIKADAEARAGQEPKE